MLKERTRFQHEVGLLSEAREYSEELYLGEAEQKSKLVRARILWPALGFPSVIAPVDKKSPGEVPWGDATRCVCVLILSNKEILSEEEAARHLRYVPWKKRHFIRQIPYRDGQEGTFRKEELRVLKPRQEGPMDGLGKLISFGANSKGEKGIVASLANRVTELYRSKELGELRFFHEIRVNETASRRLANNDLYHLFWNNEIIGENVPSDELNQLITGFALPRRKQWMSDASLLRKEYEYEYGSMHLPYKLRHGGPGRRFRTEILHPLFVRDRSAVLRIGHLTDIHVDVRADVYEENLKQGGPKYQEFLNAYNNWNKSFDKVYSKAKTDSDILLLTGDLIDYGRGFIGVESRDRLSDNTLYQPDRNWFLFYYLLASDLGSDKNTQYTIPVYTCLGNHDWRLHPYPPFAFAGTPSPRALFDDIYLKSVLPKQVREGDRKKLAEIMADDMNRALRLAHGSLKAEDPARPWKPADTADTQFLLSYDKSVESKWHSALYSVKKKIKDIDDLLRKSYTVSKTALTDKDALLRKLLGGGQILDVTGFPTETNVESVEWYLLSINPFLDYQFTLPSGHSILMLDWAENENVVFDSSYKGIMYAWGFSTDEGPRARDSLTALQKKLVEKFTEAASQSKIIGIHAPPIGPWHDWYDNELVRGWNEFELGGRGYQFYKAKMLDGQTVRGHPFFAIRPKKGVVEGAVYGMDANYGSFEKHRDWFIRRMADQKYKVRTVLSGHIHRQGLFATYKLSSLPGELLIKSLDPIKTPVSSILAGPIKFGLRDGPLYVNSTSIGPRGHLYRSKDEDNKNIYISPGFTHIELLDNGDITKVVFRSV